MIIYEIKPCAKLIYNPVGHRHLRVHKESPLVLVLNDNLWLQDLVLELHKIIIFIRGILNSKMEISCVVIILGHLNLLIALNSMSDVKYINKSCPCKWKNVLCRLVHHYMINVCGGPSLRYRYCTSYCTFLYINTLLVFMVLWSDVVIYSCFLHSI